MAFLEVIAALLVTGVIIAIMLFGGIIGSVLYFIGGIVVIFVFALVVIKESRDHRKT